MHTSVDLRITTICPSTDVIVLMRSSISKGWLKGVTLIFKKNSVQHDYSNKKHNFKSAVCQKFVLCTLQMICSEVLILTINRYYPHLQMRCGERLNNLPEVTQLLHGKGKILCVLFQGSCFPKLLKVLFIEVNLTGKLIYV